jgi:hypothetical protein
MTTTQFDEKAARELEESFDPEVRFRPLVRPASWKYISRPSGTACAV